MREQVQASRIVDGGASQSEHTWCVLMHLSLLTHALAPGVAIVVPIIMWAVRKDESPFIDDHGRECVNFQLSLVLYALLTVPVGLLTCGVGFALILGVYVLGLVGMCMGALAAGRGEFFRYPMTLRFLH